MGADAGSHFPRSLADSGQTAGGPGRDGGVAVSGRFGRRPVCGRVLSVRRIRLEALAARAPRLGLGGPRGALAGRPLADP
jgi:hypothetical protein